MSRMKDYTQQINWLLSYKSYHVVADGENLFYFDDLEEDMEPIGTWEENAADFENPDVFSEYIGVKIILLYGN